MKLAVNSLAPSFSAPDQYGQTHTLEQYAGRWLLLYFYPKDDSPGCATEACNFRDVWPELTKDIVLLGVSADSMVSHAKFSQKHHLNFPLIADVDRKIIGAYGTNGVIFNKRVSFLINPAGRIAKIYSPVNVKKHAQEVLNDVRNVSHAS